MSLVDVMNDALGQIGASRIADPDDGTANANWCKVFYPRLRRALLRSHHWNFAEKRTELALEVVAPAFEFAHSFELPSDLLKIKEYNYVYVSPPVAAIDPNYWMRYQGYYKIEGRSLLTNDSRALIVYVFDETNTTNWDALFDQVLTTWLASKLAAAIAKDARKSAELYTQAMSSLLPIALAVDGQEGTTIPYVVDDLIWGR